VRVGDGEERRVKSVLPSSARMPEAICGGERRWQEGGGRGSICTESIEGDIYSSLG
jgi:hypothetical protein